MPPHLSRPSGEPQRPRSPRARGLGLSGLLAAMFTVAASFGLVLPLAPDLVRATQGAAGDTALHAGGLTGVYMVAITIFAPVWGRLSDRAGRRWVLVAGLAGFALSMAGFGWVQSLPALYLQRALSGLFAAGVAPVAAAAVADAAPSDQWRASRMAWLNMASIGGFVLGPSLSVWVRGAAEAAASPSPAGVLAPFAAAALVAVLAAGGIAFTLPDGPTETPRDLAPTADRLLGGLLLALAFAVSLIVGVFEVAVSLRSGGLAAASSGEVAAMFAVCSLVMFLVQAVLFSPLVRAEHTWRLLAPGFALLAAALFLSAAASGLGEALVAVTIIAASAGAVSPTLAYWQSLLAGRRQGAQLGRQTAAASLGQAVGSTAGGLLLSRFGGADPFLWSAALAAGGGLAALIAVRRLRRHALSIPAADPRSTASNKPSLR